MRTIKTLALGIAALALAAPAFADPTCKADATIPMWQIAKTFEEAGGKIREMKVSDGCYEIYGSNGKTKLEIYYDPTTGAELQRESN